MRQYAQARGGAEHLRGRQTQHLFPDLSSTNVQGHCRRRGQADLIPRSVVCEMLIYPSSGIIRNCVCPRWSVCTSARSIPYVVSRSVLLRARPQVCAHASQTALCSSCSCRSVLTRARPSLLIELEIDGIHLQTCDLL